MFHQRFTEFFIVAAAFGSLIGLSSVSGLPAFPGGITNAISLPTILSSYKPTDFTVPSDVPTDVGVVPSGALVPGEDTTPVGALHGRMNKRQAFSVPTSLPTAFPSGDIPSDLPSGFSAGAHPSDLPSGFSTGDLPSDFPTDFPSGFERPSGSANAFIAAASRTSAPTALPSDFSVPSGVPTDLPSDFSIPSGSLPTNIPTARP